MHDDEFSDLVVRRLWDATGEKFSKKRWKALEEKFYEYERHDFAESFDQAKQLASDIFLEAIHLSKNKGLLSLITLT